MLVISKRLRQSLGIKISTIPIRIDNLLVWDLVLADALAVLTVLTVLTALVASVVLTALVVLVAHVAPDVAAVAVVVAAAKPISSFILLFEKVPCIVAGVFLYKIRHNGQIAVHTMIVVVLLNIYGYKG
jgi:hypothetical protein